MKLSGAIVLGQRRENEYLDVSGWDGGSMDRNVVVAAEEAAVVGHGCG